ncbi:MAG: hypothetical protein M0P73_15000 [Syntrophobacterales bacterium]|nr:hypothetical protein [Syntrophobacterales bacterium]
MSPEKYLDLKEVLLNAGYDKEIAWSEAVKPPKTALAFFHEYAWVVLNSGMKNQVASGIWYRILGALERNCTVRAVFNHPGKAAAIQDAWDNREKLFQEYQIQPTDKLLDWLQSLPWIGQITKYHLAKNLGLDFCKPDRHLVRVSGQYGRTPEGLCGELARITGDRIGTVDYVIWRAANLGMI